MKTHISRLQGKRALAAAACLLSGSVLADGNMSDPVCIDLSPGDFSFWRTAPGHRFSLDLDFPHAATKADLSVRGVRYSRDYKNLTESPFVLELPLPTAENEENVYRLKLSFDDGTELETSIAVVRGQGMDSRETDGVVVRLEGSPSDTWRRFATPRAVLPIPPGVSTVEVNGSPVETGMAGDRGWYALGPVSGGSDWEVSYSLGSEVCRAFLTADPKGFVLFIR